MRINFVMSNNVQSGIFNSLIGYFKKYLPSNVELFVTQHPIENMDIYHYHRPNLEEKLKERSVVTVHHDLEDTDPWFDASKFIIRYHEADKIICLNSMQNDFLLQNEGLSNTIVIPHGINNDIFSCNKRLPFTGKMVIGIVSKRYGRRVKGEALLSELYKRLDNQLIKFVFIGDGRSQDAVEAMSYGFEVECNEALPYRMFNILYGSLDLLLVPSLFEGGPANIPEALYTRLPIVGRKIAMISDFVVEGENGFFLTGEPDKDAQLINCLAKDENSIYSSLLESINSNQTKVLTWSEVVRKTFNVYENIIVSYEDNAECIGE